MHTATYTTCYTPHHHHAYHTLPTYYHTASPHATTTYYLPHTATTLFAWCIRADCVSRCAPRAALGATRPPSHLRTCLPPSPRAPAYHLPPPFGGRACLRQVWGAAPRHSRCMGGLYFQQSPSSLSRAELPPRALLPYTRGTSSASHSDMPPPKHSALWAGLWDGRLNQHATGTGDRSTFTVLAAYHTTPPALKPRQIYAHLHAFAIPEGPKRVSHAFHPPLPADTSPPRPARTPYSVVKVEGHLMREGQVRS